MGRYLIAHLNEGRCGEARILSPEGMAELHRPAVETRMLSNARAWYDMGWYTEQHGQMTILSHTGLVPDFYAYMALLPEKKIGAVLLYNVDHFTMQLTLTEISSAVVSRLAGDPPARLRFGFVPWIQRVLLLIPLLQIIDVIVTLGLLRGWRRDPRRRPDRKRVWGQHILLPLIPNLLASLTLIPVLSKIRGFLMLFAPDFSWIARISGGFAAIWVFLRTAFFLRAMRKS
jgi:CubicO group peptidase (beta-lactamase class C family)